MLTLLHELYTIIKRFKIAQNQVNSIDYIILIIYFNPYS